MADQAGRRRSKEHHGLGRDELLLLGQRGARSLEAGAKYGTAMGLRRLRWQKKVMRRTPALAPQ
jgi:hypothetical protein